jgi:CPA2 family monovalent cation:H+ antiporter-2
MDKDLHLADFDVPPEVEWAGKELRELNFGQQYGVHVVSILRGKKRINIPKATDRLFPNDRIQVIGTDAGLESFGAAFPQPDTSLPEDLTAQEMVLRRMPLESGSPLLGKAIKDSGIRNHYHCLVAGREKDDGNLHIPDAQDPLEEGDTLWLVGRTQNLETLFAAASEKKR